MLWWNSDRQVGDLCRRARTIMPGRLRRQSIWFQISERKMCSGISRRWRCMFPNTRCLWHKTMRSRCRAKQNRQWLKAIPYYFSGLLSGRIWHCEDCILYFYTQSSVCGVCYRLFFSFVASSLQICHSPLLNRSWKRVSRRRPVCRFAG